MTETEARHVTEVTPIDGGEGGWRAECWDCGTVLSIHPTIEEASAKASEHGYLFTDEGLAAKTPPDPHDDTVRLAHNVASSQRQWMRTMLRLMGYRLVEQTEPEYPVDRLLATYTETWSGYHGTVVIRWNESTPA